VLTFDDGPHATRTTPILDALDRYCVKAVFFSIGEMALENPQVLREVARRGHVIGTHTFSHPLSLPRLGEPRALNEIMGGFAAVGHALGGPVAPLFRFPGFNQSSALLAELEKRDISVWSVDVITNDSYVGGRSITERLFDQLDKRGHGIVLMHDIKKATMETLPGILQMLKEKGYTVPRVVIAPTITPDEQILAGIEETKPRRWQAAIHRASEKSGNAVVADRPSAPFEPFRLDGPVFPER
jgi:peptidoglycan-N-acetylglucosamine deacetylase